MDDDDACDAKMVRFEDTNPRVYKTIPINLPESGGTTSRSRQGQGWRRAGVVAHEGGSAGRHPARQARGQGHRFFQADRVRERRPRLHDILRRGLSGDFTDFVTDEDLELMAKRLGLPALGLLIVDGALCTGESRRMETRAMPSMAARAILGDIIHAVKPYFGLGVRRPLRM